jgi:hypothetical protein
LFLFYRLIYKTKTRTVIGCILPGAPGIREINMTQNYSLFFIS